jgi:hypothetical protein
MISPLDKLVEVGSLHLEKFDDGEYQGLMKSGLVRLADAQNTSLALESRFDLAYNSGHSLCLAALRKAGYRSKDRYTVFQTLPHTLGLGPEVWRVLSKAHQIRNDAEYEGFLDIEESLVKDLVKAVQAVEKALVG